LFWTGRRYSEDFYTKPTLLGEGGFGFVRLSRRKSKLDTDEVILEWSELTEKFLCSQNSLATKVIEKHSLQDWQYVDGNLAEAVLLMKMTHRNIVKVFYSK